MKGWTIAALLASASVAHATTYHVATTGNDTGAGSQAAPWKTIQRAATAARAGDTVIVHAGTYLGFRVGTVATALAPLTFVADGTVNINGAGTTDRDAIHVEGASYITIEGFTVTGAKRSGISALECDHITIRKNKLDQNATWGVFTSFCDDLLIEDNEASRSTSQHGIYASNSGDRPVIRRNYLWGNGMCGVHMNGDISMGGDGVISNAVVENNIIRDNGSLGGSGINGDGVRNAVIRNNVLDGNRASGISLYMIDGGATSTGNLVINNTIRQASTGRWAINIQDGSTGNTLRNNILLHPNASRGAIDICATCTTGLVSNNNAVVGRFMVGGAMTDLPGWRSRTGGDMTSFVATDAALFASATDLTLRAGSTAIDKGVATNAPTVDILGTPRPQGAGIDIGAYERCEGTCAGSGGGDGSGGDGDGDGGGGGGDGSGDDGTGSDGEDFGGPAFDDDGSESAGCSATGSTQAGGLLLAALVAGLRSRRRRTTAA